MKPEIKQRIEQIKAGQVPDGYKKTKIGIVPTEWNNTCFSDLFVSKGEYTEDLEKYPLYSLTIEDGVTAKSERYERSHLVKKENAYKVVEHDDFAYNPMNVRFGAVARHKGNIPVSVSGYYDIFTTKEKSDLEFMDNFLVSDKMISYYNKVSTGSLVEKQRVHFSEFIEFNLPLPSLKEREKIAKILSAQDKVIELKEKLLAEKQQYKKNIYHKLFVLKTESMERVRLSDVCTINDEIISNKSNCESFYYIDISCVETGRVNIPSQKISYIDAPVRARRKIQKRDILMSTVRPYLHAFAIVEFNAKDCVASTGFAVLRPKNNNMAEIIYHQLLSNDMDRQFLNMLVGSNYPAINASDVNQLKLWMPLHEKTCIQISKLLAIADQEISLLQKEIMQEKQKKKALMQLLLTGIVRVDI